MTAPTSVEWSDVDPWDLCLCEHAAEDHDDDGGACREEVSSGYRCSCPKFKLAVGA